MRYAHDIDAVRAAESELAATVPPGTLMQRAAAGLAAVCADLLRQRGGLDGRERGGVYGRQRGGVLGRERGGVYGRHVVLLVGSGNNGGDALYAGALLARRGAAVTALLLDPDHAHAGGRAALVRAGGRAVPANDGDLQAIQSADLVVDGIVGIGGHGGLRPEAARLADVLEHSGAAVVAVDNPSGADASDGQLDGSSVRADVTVTFGTHKPGLLIDPGASRAGAVVLVDIGLGPYLAAAAIESLQAAEVRALLPAPAATSDKYRRGVVGVVAGSGAYTGAAVLAVGGALRGGAGMVRAVGDPGVAAGIRAAWPEAVVTEIETGADPTTAGRVQSWVIGPGHGTDDHARADLEAVLAADVAVVADADALTLLADDHSMLQSRTAVTLLTPHAGELARLLGMERSVVEAKRLDSVRRAADALGVTVLLKGSTTLVADPGAAATAVRANAMGTPWLATAGSGDVLSGLAGALAAGGLDARDTGSVAAYLHGLAGRLASGGGPVIARDLIDHLPRAYAQTVADG